jgi:ubiquinone/menaquinone biosynthesis C-methylase UbiE
MAETYTLGYSDRALDFVSRRTLESHGAFFIPYLKPGMAVLDCGCGPGSITLGIAARIGEGTVVGVDMNETQVELAAENAAARAFINVSFRQGSAYALKFSDASFDAVFSHALLEHLSDPEQALREFLRVLRPGGVAGVCAPDWGGFICSPYTEELAAAMRAHNEIQNRNGGDTQVGRKLLGLMLAAGYVDVKAQARYQNYEDLSDIAGALAVQLEHGGQQQDADAMRAWAMRPVGMFAQAWVSCVGRRPRGL